MSFCPINFEPWKNGKFLKKTPKQTIQMFVKCLELKLTACTEAKL